MRFRALRMPRLMVAWPGSGERPSKATKVPGCSVLKSARGSTGRSVSAILMRAMSPLLVGAQQLAGNLAAIPEGDLQAVLADAARDVEAAGEDEAVGFVDYAGRGAFGPVVVVAVLGDRARTGDGRPDRSRARPRSRRPTSRRSAAAWPASRLRDRPRDCTKQPGCFVAAARRHARSRLISSSPASP